MRSTWRRQLLLLQQPRGCASTQQPAAASSAAAAAACQPHALSAARPTCLHTATAVAAAATVPSCSWCLRMCLLESCARRACSRTKCTLKTWRSSRQQQQAAPRR